jgi:hypothetical protein
MDETLEQHRERPEVKGNRPYGLQPNRRIWSAVARLSCCAASRMIGVSSHL